MLPTLAGRPKSFGYSGSYIAKWLWLLLETSYTAVYVVYRNAAYPKVSTSPTCMGGIDKDTYKISLTKTSHRTALICRGA